MNASQAAAIVRRAIKKTGNDPRGMVIVRNTDYYSEVTVSLRGIRDEQREEIESVIFNIGNSDKFTWNVE